MSGVSAQLGIKTETTWGTAVTVDKFLPFRSEGIKNDGGSSIPSKALRAGRRVQHTHRRSVPIIGGPVVVEFGNTGIAAVLKHCFGAVATTGSGPYTHTYTPGSLRGKSFTAQVGRPDAGGTVRPRTWAGCKIPDWEIAATSPGEVVLLNLNVSAASETGATGLATASYTSGWDPFIFEDGAVTASGSSIRVDSFSLKGNNGLRTDRKAMGGSTITEQLGNAMVGLTISLTMDFEDLTQYDKVLDDSSLTLVLTLTNGSDTFTVTAKGYLVGDSPTVAGPEVLKQPLEFVIESVTSDADAFTAVLVNGESSAA